MEILAFPMEYKCVYWLVAILTSIGYGIRAFYIQKHHVANENIQLYSAQLKQWGEGELWITHYVHDILFNTIASLAGFLSFYLECILFRAIVNLSDIGTGTAAILVFLSLFSISGITGMLPPLLLWGKMFSK